MIRIPGIYAVKFSFRLVFFYLFCLFITKFSSRSCSHFNAKVYVFYYDEISKKNAVNLTRYHWANMLELGTTVWFENQGLLKISQNEFVSQWETQDYVGILSHKTVSKQKVHAEIIFPKENLTGTLYNPGKNLSPDFDWFHEFVCESNHSDFISFYQSSLNMVSGANYFHPLFRRIWNRLLSRLGYTHAQISESDSIPFYPCNAWVMKTSWLKKYLLFLKKAIDTLTTDEELKKIMYENSRYNGKLNSSMLLRIFGKPYYGYHPFVIERLPSLFVHTHHLKTYSRNIVHPINKFLFI